MPLYEYELCEGDCFVCDKGFFVYQSVSDRLLAVCPTCQRAVRKIISLPIVPRISRPVSHSDAKKAGFTIYKRSGKGEYERQ